jgi:hypothetical protein
MGLARAFDSVGPDARRIQVPERATTQAECDAILAEARRNRARPTILREVVPPAPKPLQPTEDLLESRLAEEIDYARRMLEVVGDRFVSDSIVLQRHQTTMQSFDIIGQLLGHLVKVIGSQDKDEAINRIGMQELRARLLRPIAPITSTGTMSCFQRSDSNPFREE